MVTIKEKEQALEKEITEQVEVEKKLTSRRKKADQTKTEEKKKGHRVSYQPARRLPKLNAPEGFVPAWKHNTPEEIRRCQQEGWVIADRNKHKVDLDMGDYYKKINDAPVKDGTSIITHNEMIGMFLPEEIAQARKEYVQKETEDQTRAKLNPHMNAQNRGVAQRANVTTNIEIE